MKSLRWVGLVFSLLIVGVLGGLMAPLPSEAGVVVAPSLKLKVDNGTEVELITTNSTAAAAACIDTEKSSGGFTHCYRLKTGSDSYAPGNSGRTYQVTGVGTPGATLNVADTDGGLQKFKTSTLRITPTATDWGCNQADRLANCNNALETHTILLTLTLPFEVVEDSNTTFQGMLLTEGNFYPVPATVPLGQVKYTVKNDTIELTANGKFNSSDGSGTAGRAMTGDTTTGKFYSRLTGGVTTSNLRGPLRFQYGGTATTSQYYSLNQTQADYDANGTTPNTYPIYTTCQNASFSNKCAPTITAVYKVIVYGPDTIELLTSNDLFWGGCDITNNKGGQTPQGPPCFSSSKKKGLNDTLAAASQASTAANTAAAIATGSTAGEQCVVDCPCAYEECQGKIVIELRHSNNVTQQLSFPFAATGPDIALSPDPAYNFLVATNATTKTGQTPFPNLFVGNLTAPWTFAALIESFPPISGFNGGWKVDSIDCESELNEPAVYNAIGELISPAVIVSTWTTDSGSDKRNASVTKLGKGDVVTCSWHAHKNSSGN
jgi:hypothetical protein